MKYFWIFCFVILGSIQTANAQFNFKQHKVEAGEDVYSIAKLYGTTPEAIYGLNPMAKEGIQPGAFLVLPNIVDLPEKHVPGIVFKKHKTRKKETLYSIARKYKITVDQIKEHNDFLENDPLRKGDILRIPLPAPKTNRVVRKLGGRKDKKGEVVENKSLKTTIYKVQPKDTRYGIARKYGITIPELENMNPNLGEDFPIGIQILVPEEISEEKPESNNEFKLYEVLPKETIYSLTKRFEISSDSLRILNPEVQEGLKAGMILRLPDLNPFSVEGENPTIQLQDQINNAAVKNIAVMLPFSVNEVDFSDEEKIKTHIKKSKVVRMTVDFYSGVLLAAAKAKQNGISVNLDIYDTEKSDKKVTQLISDKKLAASDAVIGPLYKKNVEKAASVLNSTKTPVFSPISNKVQASYSNLFQTFPTAEILQDKIINFVKKDSLTKKNIIIIADARNSAVKKKLMDAFPDAKILDPEEKNFVKVDKLEKVIKGDESKIPTWVFLESSNMQLVSNVIPFLNARAKSHKITLFTANKSDAYDSETVLNSHLSNLNFHYPSPKREVNSDERSKFYLAYKAKYGTTPNHYAVRGYDLTYDLILRLATSTDIYSQTSQRFTTEYNENKFSYIPNLKGGYGNNACYIIKYAKGLEFKIVE